MSVDRGIPEMAVKAVSPRRGERRRPDEKVHAEVLRVLLAGQGTMFFAGMTVGNATIIAKRTVLEKCPSENPPR